MRVDVEDSRYHEADTARGEFQTEELDNLRYLLRRLRFLETRLRRDGGPDAASGGALHAQREMDALSWALTEIGFLDAHVEGR